MASQPLAEADQDRVSRGHYATFQMVGVSRQMFTRIGGMSVCKTEPSACFNGGGSLFSPVRARRGAFPCSNEGGMW